MAVTTEVIAKTFAFDSESGPTATIVEDIDGVDLTNYLVEKFGVVILDEIGFYITKRERHPDSPFMFAKSFDAVAAPPEDPPHGSEQLYERMRITMQYTGILVNVSIDMLQAVSFPSQPDTAFISHRIEFTTDPITVPGGVYKWDDGNDNAVNPTEHVVVIRPVVTHRLTVYNWRFPPFRMMKEKMGHLNEDVFPWAFEDGADCLDEIGLQVAVTDQDWAAGGTVLMLPPTVDPFENSTGQSHWQIGYTFVEKALRYDPAKVAGWNHFPRPNDPDNNVAWRRIISQEGNYPYPYAKFVEIGDSLFESDPP